MCLHFELLYLQPRTQALLPTPSFTFAAAPGVGKRAWVRGCYICKMIFFDDLRCLCGLDCSVSCSAVCSVEEDNSVFSSSLSNVDATILSFLFHSRSSQIRLTQRLFTLTTVACLWVMTV